MTLDASTLVTALKLYAPINVKQLRKNIKSKLL